MFIFYILTYITFMLIMRWFAKMSANTGGMAKIDKYLICYLLFFGLVSGTRWCVGADYWAYRLQFSGSENISAYYENKEYLWYAFLIIHNKLGLHFSIGLGITAFLQLFFLVKGLKEYKYIIIVLPFVLFANFFYWEMMNGMRQILVSCIMFYASKYIYERNCLKYFTFLFICYFIHHSVVMLVPFYFMPNGFKLAERRNFCLLAFIICVAVGRFPAFQSLASSASQLTSFMGYANYSERVNDYLAEGVDEMRSLGPMFLSLMAMCFITIWYAPTLYRRYIGEIKLFDLWYNFSFLFACSYFLFSSVDIMFIRPTYYFAFYLLVIASLLLYYLYENRGKYGVLYILIWTIFAISMFRDMQKNEAIYPYDLSIYKSILFHD